MQNKDIEYLNYKYVQLYSNSADTQFHAYTLFERNS